MRKFLTSGRRRYALLLFVAAGSIVLMGNQCAPTKEPVKPQPPEPPAPTGLSISPTSHDFGDVLAVETSDPQTFTVTNNGPNESGTLNVFIGPNFNPVDFKGFNNTCTGTLPAGDTCTIDIIFDPVTIGKKQAELIAKTDNVDDGQAVATLIGNATT